MPAGVSAFTPLANITLGSAQATVTFSSISGSYRDLRLVVQSTATGGGNNLYMRFNADSGANYSSVYAYGNGTTTASTAATEAQITTLASYVTSVQNTQLFDIFDYTASKYKSVLRRGNGSAAVEMSAANWLSTSTITTIEIICSGSTFAAGSTFALYGVSA